MRFIDIEKIADKVADKKWAQIEKVHLEQLRATENKSKYINDNPVWTDLYALLSEASNHKCWYTESKENSNYWEIDHFRPKNRAKNITKDPIDIDRRTVTLTRPDGYWWLAYEWRNYRVSGSLVNKRRRDKFDPDAEVTGKGDYFPIDLSQGTLAQPEQDTDCEVNVLLDSTNAHDTTLISFDENGEVISAAKTEFDDFRVEVSIELYALQQRPLIRGRKNVWDACKIEIENAKRKIMQDDDERMRGYVLKECFQKLRNMASDAAEYSMVAKRCIQFYSKQTGYKWLEDLSAVI